MKKIRFIIATAALLLSANFAGAKEAKYVFFFIGDGMGINQVVGTEYYLGELAGHIGVERLLFTQFPTSGIITTYSASTDVTDSSAAGTALASGTKTENNVMAMLPDKKTPLESIAAKAHNQGRRVAICSTVGVDHATPAVFYAHTANRNEQHTIANQLAESGYEFFAGGDFAQNVDRRNPESKSNWDYALENGYTIVRGYDEYKAKSATSDKMILFQKERADGSNTSFMAAIDQKDEDLDLPQLTQAAIDFMMKEPKKGFFMMLEGGNIDHYCHGNDAVTSFREIIDFDNAIKVAYEFYEQHKDETLIVVSADHETGGLSLGNGSYRLALKNLQYQTISEEQFAHHLEQLTKEKKDSLTWDEIKSELTEYFGFFDKVRLTSAQEQALMDAYAQTFVVRQRRRPAQAQTAENAETPKEEFYEYYKADALSDLAVKTMCDISQIAWGTGQHSAGVVPVFAVGAGAELFDGMYDNTDVPVRMAKAAGIKW